jgi:hypothetical protein
MSLQSRETSEFSELPSHNFGLENCPACGQAIPLDKLEEISGKIAARERERVISITAKLEKQNATERAAVETKAKADLESERQRSAAREAELRHEVQQAAEKLIAQKTEEAQRDRQKLVDRWQQQIDEAESRRKFAEQTGADLQSELDKIRRNSAKALETMQVQANLREIEVRIEARQKAESAAAERVAAIEAEHRETGAAVQAKLKEAEASRIAAEKKETTLQLQLERLQKGNEAEVTRLKEHAATEATRIRQKATEAAEIRFRDSLAAQEKVAAEANAKLREVQQRASEMEQNLSSQREIMEKDKEDAVNAEKARAFEENQKLSSKVSDLQRAFDKKTNEELGEGAEINIFEALKSEFKDDKIERIPKGTPGADIRHVVMLHGQNCGTILYDSKNHMQWRTEHVAKLKKDQLAEKAEHAILSTHKFPQGTRQIHNEDGILLANPARVVSVATIVRQHLVQLHTLRLSKIERDSKTAALYEFIISDRCTQLLGRIDERASSLLEQQEKEIRWHQNSWRRQGESIRAIQKAKVDLESEIDSIIGTSADDDEISEAS